MDHVLLCPAMAGVVMTVSVSQLQFDQETLLERSQRPQ